MATYDRAAEDLGNIAILEHVNTRVPDQRPATLYYIAGLGLTRDPYMMTSVTNMWANIGRSQFHLPTGAAQVVRGRTGVVIPDRDALLKRLETVAPLLKDTKFGFTAGKDLVDTTCPWGNRIRCHTPGSGFGRMQLGIAYVEFDCPRGSAEGITRFYRTILGAPASVDTDAGAARAKVVVGADQWIIFRETDAAQPAYDGHHVAIYISDFSGPHRRLLERGLVTQESDQHQYRFDQLIDPASGKPLFQIEHEVRSLRHPFYARPLVNRDPRRNNMSFALGYEDLSWSTPPR